MTITTGTWNAVLKALIPALCILAAAGCERAPPEYDGAALYAANCAQCHGSYGEGSTVTSSLEVVRTDLRFMSVFAGGEFPASFAARIVDGRETRAAHGPNGMPIWGREFSKQEGFDEAAEQRVTAKVNAIVTYLERIQQPLPGDA